MPADRLTPNTGESREARGPVGDRSVMEIRRSDESGTWSVVVTQPSGEACILATGADWPPVGGKAPGDPTRGRRNACLSKA